MNRKEFIQQLHAGLGGMPEEERSAAIEYYEEYFDEAGEENEATVLEELGSPKKIAAQIRSEHEVRALDEVKMPAVKRGASALKWMLIGIGSSPISLPLAIVLIVLAVVGSIVFIGCVIALIAGIVGILACGIALVVLGVMAVPAALSTAALFAGAGLTLLGMALALGYLLIWGIRAASASMRRAWRKWMEKRREEKMERMKEEGGWKYREEAN